jgi:cation transport regulator ChaB
MPYSKGNLPDYVKKLSEKEQETWMGAFNGSHEACMKKEGAESKACETSAFAIANAAVKKENGGKCIECGDKACKCWVNEMASAPIVDMTATTFEDLEAEDMAKEAAEKVNKIAYQTEDLVHNVMRNPEIEDKPSALSRIVEGLKTRLTGLMMKSKREKYIPKGDKLERSYFTTTKDIDGNYRWFTLVSNYFRDADNPPEIFETKAHKEFISYLDNGGEMPELWLWHTPGTKIGKADWADFDNGFLMASGTFDKDKKDVAEALAKDSNLGVSHGYNYRYSNKEKGIIGWYRTFEISPLPRDKAANPWTGIEVIAQEANMDKNKRAFLVTKLGEDRVKELEKQPADLSKSLHDMGIEYKEIETPAKVEPPVAEKTVEKPAEVEPDPIMESVKAANARLEKLEAVIVEMSASIKALKKSDDEKIADTIAPKSQTAGAKRATESPDNVIDPNSEEGKKLAAEKAAPSWLKAAIPFKK